MVRIVQRFHCSQLPPHKLIACSLSPHVDMAKPTVNHLDLCQQRRIQAGLDPEICTMRSAR